MKILETKTLGAIESFTGGLFASTIIAQQGASKYFKGAVVAYHNSIKSQLGIDVSHGVINAATALAMTKRGRAFLGVDICVAFTGNAGPEPMENQPVGKVFIAINDEVYELSLIGGRNAIRQQAVDFVIEKLNNM